MGKLSIALSASTRSSNWRQGEFLAAQRRKRLVQPQSLDAPSFPRGTTGLKCWLCLLGLFLSPSPGARSVAEVAMSRQYRDLTGVSTDAVGTAVEEFVPDKTNDSHNFPNWQFSLRTLFISVAVVAGLLAIMAVVNALTSVLLVWFVLLVFCHVAANAWGSKSKRRAMQPVGEHLPCDQLPKALTPAAIPSAEVPRSHLSHRRALSWWLFLPIPAGAVLGAYAGVNMLYGDLASVPNWKTFAVTSVSSAALGGFLAFLVSSFLGVAIFAVFDAQRQAAKG